MPYNQYTGEYYDVTSRGTNDLVCLTVMLWSYNDSDNAGQPLGPSCHREWPAQLSLQQ